MDQFPPQKSSPQKSSPQKSPPQKTGDSPNESVDFEQQQQGSWLCPSSRSSPKTGKGSPHEAESPTGGRGGKRGKGGRGAGGDDGGPPNPFAEKYGRRRPGWTPPSWKSPGTELFFLTPEKNEYYVKLGPVDEVPPYRCLPKCEVNIFGLSFRNKNLPAPPEPTPTRPGRPSPRTGAAATTQGSAKPPSGGGPDQGLEGMMGGGDGGMMMGGGNLDEGNPFAN